MIGTSLADSLGALDLNDWSQNPKSVGQTLASNAIGNLTQPFAQAQSHFSAHGLGDTDLGQANAQGLRPVLPSGMDKLKQNFTMQNLGQQALQGNGMSAQDITNFGGQPGSGAMPGQTNIQLHRGLIGRIAHNWLDGQMS